MSVPISLPISLYPVHGTEFFVEGVAVKLDKLLERRDTRPIEVCVGNLEEST